MPPPFTASHCWSCPSWVWSSSRSTPPAVWPAPTRTYYGNQTTTLFLVNTSSAAVNTHVEAYTSDGQREPEIVVGGLVAPMQQRAAVVGVRRQVPVAENGDFSDHLEGHFMLWTTAPLTVAVRYQYSHSAGLDRTYMIPVQSVEVTVDVAPAPPSVPGTPAPEGGGGGGGGVDGGVLEPVDFNTTFTPEQAEAWIVRQGVASPGRPIRPR